MTIWLITPLAYFAHVSALAKGNIVYPVIVNEKGDGSTRAKLVLSPTHSLEMEDVSLFGDTYIQRIEINGTAVDLLLDSAFLQNNMYQCRQNMATYTVDYVGGSMYVEGLVNTTHAIVPIKHRTKHASRIPHKIYSIHKNHSGTFSKTTEADFVKNANTRRLGRQRKRHLRNNTIATTRYRPEERGKYPFSSMHS